MSEQPTGQSVLAELEGFRRELNDLSLKLAHVDRELEPTEKAYTEFVDAFEIGLWEKHLNDGEKLPSEKLRTQLAHRAMDPALYGRYFALVKSRDRMLKRISTLKVEVEAQRSLLSAMKEGIV